MRASVHSNYIYCRVLSKVLTCYDLLIWHKSHFLVTICYYYDFFCSQTETDKVPPFIIIYFSHMLYNLQQLTINIRISGRKKFIGWVNTNTTHNISIWIIKWQNKRKSIKKVTDRFNSRCFIIFFSML